MADALATGWCAYRADEPEDDEPEVVFYCSQCAEREFGEPSAAGGAASRWDQSG